MSILLPLLIAATPVTSDNICWMVMDGQTFNLGHLCGEVSPVTSPLTPGPLPASATATSEAAFIIELESNLSPFAAGIFDDADSVAFGLDYCSARREGVSESEYKQYFQYGVSLGLGDQTMSPQEEALALDIVEEYYTAVTSAAPRHFCPEVNF